MLTAYQVAPAAIYRGAKPVRSPKYTRWLKRFACVACSSSRCVDPAHTGAHALGQKSSDLDCLPLCRQCHDEFDADPRGFEIARQLDIPAVIQCFNRLWEVKERTTA